MDIQQINRKEYINGIRRYNAIAQNSDKQPLAQMAGVPDETLTVEAFNTFKNVLKVWEIVKPGDKVNPDEVYELSINDPVK